MPQIIRFNEINTKLLKSANKESYKRLRWEADFSHWKKLDDDLTEEDFKWWCENIRNIKGYDIPERLNKTGSSHGYIKIRAKLMKLYAKVGEKYNNKVRTFLKHVTWNDIENHQKDFNDPLSKQDFEYFNQERKDLNSCVQKFMEDPSTAVDWGDVIDYKSGNYLFDDTLYARLHDLAVHNKITTIQLDLRSVDGQKVLIDTIKKIDRKIAVLDLNNLYLYRYMGESNFRRALNALLEYGTPHAILILMGNYKDYPCAQFSIYLGFTFENISSWPIQPFFDNFINGLPSDIYPLIDGRLYERDDTLPFYLLNAWK